LFIIFLLYSAAAIVVLSKDVGIFIPYSSSQTTLTVSLYLFTSLIQGLSTILGITVAVIFITAQTSTRSKFTHTLKNLYSESTTLTTISIFFVAISSNVVCLPLIRYIIDHSLYWVIDINILTAVLAVFLLIPLIVAQIENIDPYQRAVKLSRNITVDRLRSYGLVEIRTQRNDTLSIEYELKPWSRVRGEDDPLKPIHEVVMSAVRRQDRLQLSSLIRLLFSRIAKYHGVQLTASPTGLNQPKLAISQWYDIIYKYTAPISPTPDRIVITLHIMHYVVRRSHYLRDEWSDSVLYSNHNPLAFVLRQFVSDVTDLILSLNERDFSTYTIDICLYGIMHICLGYADMSNRQGPNHLMAVFELCSELDQAGKYEQAALCAEILGYIRCRTHLIGRDSHRTGKQSLSPELRDTYREAYTQSCQMDNWFPGDQDRDPWHSRLSHYPLRNPTNSEENNHNAQKLGHIAPLVRRVLRRFSNIITSL